MAHASQLFAVPDGLSDADAVTTEPVACAVHAVLGPESARGCGRRRSGAGTLGLTVIAALTHLAATGRCPAPRSLLVGARYAHQLRLAREFGATEALPPDQLRGGAPAQPLVVLRRSPGQTATQPAGPMW